MSRRTIRLGAKLSLLNSPPTRKPSHRRPPNKAREGVDQLSGDHILHHNHSGPQRKRQIGSGSQPNGKATMMTPPPPPPPPSSSGKVVKHNTCPSSIKCHNRYMLLTERTVTENAEKFCGTQHDDSNSKSKEWTQGTRKEEEYEATRRGTIWLGARRKIEYKFLSQLPIFVSHSFLVIVFKFRERTF